MLPTMRVVHLSCMIAAGLKVPDPFLGRVQQGKIEKSLCHSTASYLKLVNGNCVDKGTISSLRGCVCMNL